MNNTKVYFYVFILIIISFFAFFILNTSNEFWEVQNFGEENCFSSKYEIEINSIFNEDEIKITRKTNELICFRTKQRSKLNSLKNLTNEIEDINVTDFENEVFDEDESMFNLILVLAVIILVSLIVVVGYIVGKKEEFD